jgi:hypothetical protein
MSMIFSSLKFSKLYRQKYLRERVLHLRGMKKTAEHDNKIRYACFSISTKNYLGKSEVFEFYCLKYAA